MCYKFLSFISSLTLGLGVVIVALVLERLTWKEVDELNRDECVVVVPAGSFEQHGYHMPLNTDAYIPYKLALLSSERASGFKLIVAPPITYGCSEHYMGFPGTISLRTETLKLLVKDVCRSIIRHGFRRIIVLNGHGGNFAPLQIAIRELKGEVNAVIALVNWWDLVADVIRGVRESKVMHHADEVETSVALALGQRVMMDKAVDFVPEPFSDYYTLDLVSPPPKLMVFGWLKRKGAGGVVGEASKASREKGEIIVETAVSRIIDLAQRLLRIEV